MTDLSETRAELDPGELAKLRAAIVALGEPLVVGHIGLARATFARALAGLPVHRGSVALIRRYLAGRSP